MVHRNAEEYDWEQAQINVRAKYHKWLRERQAKELVHKSNRDLTRHKGAGLGEFTQRSKTLGKINKKIKVWV